MKLDRQTPVATESEVPKGGLVAKGQNCLATAAKWHEIHMNRLRTKNKPGNKVSFKVNTKKLHENKAGLNQPTLFDLIIRAKAEYWRRK